ncbi:MAG TPA: hypothetical protein ENH10_04215, partial [Bacteroidetes bacterium]|nr:hypothetical protein [Bacteroidota bacterium]HEX04349.1 hypothetical protein [Bacteroidota bacterium]
GGFVLTAVVYIFQIKEFYPIVRPAVLTAFLGYVAVVLGLLFDLGLPWNIWHMIIYWNPHSPLFEVGWCVMLYLSVLTLEFLPVPLEDQPRWSKIHDTLTKFRIPLVIAGISLSTLHQSSLGTLFTIMPYRIHPLWYSPILPILFFLSAIALGLFMITFEGHTTTWIYRRHSHRDMLAKLNRATPWVVLTYIVVRIGDLTIRGQIHHAFTTDWHAIAFWIEIGFLLIPAVLTMVKRVRRSDGLLWLVSFLGLMGVVVNRINTGGVMHTGRGIGAYLPSWTEFAISFGVVAVAGLIFLWLVEHFNILESKPIDEENYPEVKPKFDNLSRTWLGLPSFANRARFSLSFVIMAGVGFLLLSGESVRSSGVEPEIALPARGGDTLWVDGNRDRFGVSFHHAAHVVRADSLYNGCATCHHLNLPGDKNTECSSCHRDMYSATDAFGHDWHANSNGAKLSCSECHPQGEVRQAETAAECVTCHKDLIPAAVGERTLLFDYPVKGYLAPSYADAMHGVCLECHYLVAEEKQDVRFQQCSFCHSEHPSFVNVGPEEYPTSGKVIVPLDLGETGQ